MIVVSFEQNLESVNVELYKTLFTNINNPNGCPARGSFYIQDDGTNYNVVRTLFDEGHEIGVHSLDGTIPKANQWITMYKSKLTIIAECPIQTCIVPWIQQNL